MAQASPHLSPPPQESDVAKYETEEAAYNVEAHLGQVQEQQEQVQQQQAIDEDSFHDRKYPETPRNTSGLIICTRPECAGKTFERRCEWTKHMDKHDRPYRCDRPGCEKLRGFTYSGGLLRHQREVHKEHGGPKENLMCPVPYCKRNTGSGFTRKENLNEHLRRVHRHIGPPVGHENDEEDRPPVDPLMAVQHESDAAATSVTGNHAAQHAPSAAEPLQNPFDATTLPQPSAQVSMTSPQMDENAMTPSHKSRKRRRTPQASCIPDDHDQVASLRDEVERLRRLNDEKDQRISRLEETVHMFTLTHQQQHQILQDGTSVPAYEASVQGPSQTESYTASDAVSERPQPTGIEDSDNRSEELKRQMHQAQQSLQATPDVGRDPDSGALSHPPAVHA